MLGVVTAETVVTSSMSHHAVLGSMAGRMSPLRSNCQNEAAILPNRIQQRYSVKYLGITKYIMDPNRQQSCSLLKKSHKWNSLDFLMLFFHTKSLLPIKSAVMFRLTAQSGLFCLHVPSSYVADMQCNVDWKFRVLSVFQLLTTTSQSGCRVEVLQSSYKK